MIAIPPLLALGPGFVNKAIYIKLITKTQLGMNTTQAKTKMGIRIYFHNLSNPMPKNKEIMIGANRNKL